MTGRAYTAVEWPHGLRCGECERPFEEGMPISEQVADMIGDTPAVVLVCVSCGLVRPVR